MAGSACGADPLGAVPCVVIGAGAAGDVLTGAGEAGVDVGTIVGEGGGGAADCWVGGALVPAIVGGDSGRATTGAMVG